MNYQPHNIGKRQERILPVQTAFDAEAVTYRVLETSKDIQRYLKSIPKGARVAVDTETTGLDPLVHKIILVQMSYDGSNIVMFDPELLGNVLTWDAFQILMESKSITKVFHNAKFDMKMLHQHFKFEFVNCDCTLVMRKLLTAGLRTPASLAACSFDYLGYRMEKATREDFIGFGEDEEEEEEEERETPSTGLGGVSTISKMTTEMLRYAALDVAATWHIFPILSKYLEIERMTDVYNYIERDLVWVVAQIELEGISISIPYLRDVIQPMLEEKIHTLQLDVDATLKFLRAMPKKERKIREDETAFLAKGWTHVLDWVPTLNVNAPKAVKEALNNLGLDLKNTKAATLEQPTYTPESLRDGRLRADRGLTPEKHWSYCAEMCKKILELKKARKAMNAFVVPLQGKFIHPATGKIHCELNQNGAGTGRFTHKKPNLAQMPKPNTEGIFGTTPLRRAFTFPEGTKPIVWDYSACELRILAEITQDQNLCRNVTLPDPHRDNAILMYPDVDPAQITKDSVYRQRAKNGIYLKCYGGGAARLAATLGISIEEAAGVLRALSDAFNFAEYETRTKAIATQRGYAVTLAGRKRYFELPDISVLSKWDYRRRIGEIERAALNHPIQGTNADITKLAMVWASEALKPFGGKLVMSIHDELVAWAPEAVAEKAAEAMGNAMLRAEREFLRMVEPGIDGGVRDDWSH